MKEKVRVFAIFATKTTLYIRYTWMQKTNTLCTSDAAYMASNFIHNMKF